MARRPHPYFGQLNRLEQALVASSGSGSGAAPAMSAEDQQGVLWQAFREAAEPA